MRVGLSWDLGGAPRATQAFATIAAEAATAGRLGYDSVWVRESRGSAAALSQPTLVLTALARKDSTLALRTIREVVRANPVRLAEEVAVLDVFSRGRAGLAFAAARPGEASARVHETIEFVRAAWATDDFRYRGEHIRFPAHTGADAPAGVSRPGARGTYPPQWEWGPATPDFLTVTPKPHAPRPPLYAEIEYPETLGWAAAQGISPFVGAAVPVDEAVERLRSYRKAADSAGRSPDEVEVVLERAITVAGGDATAIGGDPGAVITAIRDIAAGGGVGHIVWQRRGAGDADLLRFAVDVYPLLQA